MGDKMKNNKRIVSILFLTALLIAMATLSLTMTACKTPETESYTISYSTENALYGSVSGTCDSGAKVEKGKAVTLTATPSDEGYEFLGWYSQSQLKSNANPYEFEVTDNVTLVAKFKELWHHHNYKHLAYSIDENDVIYRTTKCSCGEEKTAEFTDYTSVIDTSGLLSALVSTGEKNRLVVLDSGWVFSFVEIYDLNHFDENITIIGKEGASINGMMINSGKNDSNANATTDVMPSGVTFIGVEFTADFKVANCSMDKLTLKDCTFTNGAGIAIRSNSYDGLDENLLVRPAHQKNTVSNVTIENCVFERNAGVYQKTKIYLFDIDGVTIKNNLISNCEYNAIQINNKSLDGIYGNVVIEGNEISDTIDRAIRITSIKGNITIKNNAFSYIALSSDNAGEVIKASSKATSTVVIFEGNTIDSQPLTLDGVKVQGLN